jgi:hypothetical protein
MISKLPVENHAPKEVAQKHCLRLWMISSCPPRSCQFFDETKLVVLWFFFKT